MSDSATVVAAAAAATGDAAAATDGAAAQNNAGATAAASDNNAANGSATTGATAAAAQTATNTVAATVEANAGVSQAEMAAAYAAYNIPQQSALANTTALQSGQMQNEEPEHERNLIVNYLPNSVSEVQFIAMFAPYGEIERAKLMLDLHLGTSKGFGFVKYKSSAAAQTAILALNGLQIEGKRLRVSLARPDGQAPAGVRPGSTGSQLLQTAPSMTDVNLYISNLNPMHTKEHLISLFSAYGTVTDARILLDPATNQSRGCGFVKYNFAEEAQRAIEGLNGTQLAGCVKPLGVKIADSTKNKIMGARVPVMAQAYAAQTQQARYAPYGQATMAYGQPGQTYGAFTPQQTAAYGASPYGQFAQQPAAAAAYTQQPVVYQNMASQPIVGAAPVYAQQGQFQAQPPQQQQAMFGAAALPTPGAKGHAMFVYNVPTEADDAWLMALFQPYGTVVEGKVVRDPATNANKGFGFVHMSTLQESYAAITALNGAQVHGRTLQVSLKKDK